MLKTKNLPHILDMAGKPNKPLLYTSLLRQMRDPAARLSSSKVVHLYLDLLQACHSGADLPKLKDGSAMREAVHRLTSGRYVWPLKSTVADSARLLVDTMAEYALQGDTMAEYVLHGAYGGHFFQISIETDTRDVSQRRVKVSERVLAKIAIIFVKLNLTREGTFAYVHTFPNTWHECHFSK